MNNEVGMVTNSTDGTADAENFGLFLVWLFRRPHSPAISIPSWLYYLFYCKRAREKVFILSTYSCVFETLQLHTISDIVDNFAAANYLLKHKYLDRLQFCFKFRLIYISKQVKN